MIYCSGCGTEIHETAKACPSCGAPTGMGSLPEGIRGWSWGAFLLNWVWAIGNRTWIGLLALIPYVNIVVAIILGIKGREWAWKNKKWESVEHFNRVQRKWSIWGVAVVLILAVIAVVAEAVILPAWKDDQMRSAAAANAAIARELNAMTSGADERQQ